MKALLYREIGDNAIYYTPKRDDIFHIITTIQLSGTYKEFGSTANTQFDSLVHEIRELREEVKLGIVDHKTIAERHPKVCFLYPSLVLKYIRETAPPPSPASEYHDWVNSGSPEGLALKVYREWKAGNTYKASPIEWSARMSFLKDMEESLAEKVFAAWVKGETYTE